jgi:CPA2 family monovalent cation:H+ antiporter-2
VGSELLAVGALLTLAAALGRVARRVGLPTIPVYMLLGLLGSPAVAAFPVNITHDQLELVAAFGLVLLLFHLGLEFDLDDFFNSARSVVIAGITSLTFTVGLGLGFGWMLGWGTREAFVIAGITGVSSSAIVTKLLIELKRLTNAETPMILGVILIEDLFLAVYLALIGGALGENVSVGNTLTRLAGSLVFLVAMFTLARKGGQWVGRIIGTPDAELFTITFFGLALLVAGAAEQIGVSEAIGAFLMGLIIAGTHHRDRVEALVLPLRDVFAAFFFLAFGLTLDPATFGTVAGPVAVAVVLAVVANLTAEQINAKRRGLGVAAGLNAGLTLVARGEFALILATLAAGAGLDDRISAFAGLYVVVLAVIGPVLATHAPAIGRRLAGSRERVSVGRT